MLRSPLSSSPLQVWAVEDDAIQLTWGDLPPGTVTAWAGDLHAAVDHQGGAGSLELWPLAPDTSYRIDVSWVGGRRQLVARTLAPPPGELLCRIATVSDLHLGAHRWGLSKTMVDRSDAKDPFPYRCARAAINEAVDWGAELLLVKGDAVHHQDADHFAQLGELFDSVPELPVLLVPGNHEVDGEGAAPIPAKVGDRGIPYVRSSTSVDLTGVRVIMADSTVAGRGVGTVERCRADVIELAALSTGPFLLGMHHQLHRFPFPTHYPFGVPAPESTGFLHELAEANPFGIVTSGHTHRNRTRSHGPLVVSEVASTRDWPGVWGGYAIHEGGIRQVVRRVVADDAIGWHEYSRRALVGIWEKWTVGRLSHRCFSHPWQ